MRLLLFAALPLALACGCTASQPTLSGGKPVDYWVESLRSSPDAKLRKEAAFKLGNVGPTDSKALPALVSALKDRDAAVRCEAILALVKFGSAALEASAVLAELRQHDHDPRVRTYATKALEKLNEAK